MKNSIFFPLAFCLILIVSCQNKQEKRDEISETEADEVFEQLESLEQKVNGTYYFMQDDDEMKIKNLGLILEEIKKSGIQDAGTFEKSEKNYQKLVSKKLKIQDLQDSDKIDEFDALYRKMATEIIEMAENHPNFHQNPDMEDLIILIRNLEARQLSNRVEYDAAALEYNQYVKENKSKIGKKLEGKSEKYGRFSLGEE